jgi:hypothetical protein
MCPRRDARSVAVKAPSPPRGQGTKHRLPNGGWAGQGTVASRTTPTPFERCAFAIPSSRSDEASSSHGRMGCDHDRHVSSLVTKATMQDLAPSSKEPSPSPRGSSGGWLLRRPLRELGTSSIRLGFVLPLHEYLRLRASASWTSRSSSSSTTTVSFTDRSRASFISSSADVSLSDRSTTCLYTSSADVS